jgi:hypothetical protein
VRAGLGFEPFGLLKNVGNCGGKPPGGAGVSTDAVSGCVESKFMNWMFELHGTVMMLDGPGVCVGVGLGFGDGVGVGLLTGVGGGDTSAYPSMKPYVGSIVGCMLAYAIETKTFAVGVGDGVGVGEPLGSGDGLPTGDTEELWEHPPVPTTDAAKIAQATSAIERSGRAESDIETNPFTRSCLRSARAARALSRSSRRTSSRRRLRRG